VYTHRDNTSTVVLRIFFCIVNEKAFFFVSLSFSFPDDDEPNISFG